MKPNSDQPAPVIDKSDANWHIDRKVPVAVVLALMVQTGGFIWWGAKADARLDAVERKIELSSPQGDRLTRVEVNIETIKDSLTEIKAVIRKPR